MAVYDEDIQAAQELIDEFGQTCYWVKPAAATAGVPGYPGVGAVPDDIECKIAFFSPKDLDRGTMKALGMMVDSEVSESTQVGLMAGGINFTPENPDSIRRGAPGADPIAIIDIDYVAPNGTPVLYFITVAA